MVVTGADYNRLRNYKITKFTVFVSGDGESGDRGREAHATLLTFEGQGATKIEQVQSRGKGSPNLADFVIIQ